MGTCIYGEEGICPVCHHLADPMAVVEKNDRIARHNFVFDSILSTAHSVVLAPRKEVPSLISGIRSHPAGFVLPNWSGGHPAALDVAVISPMQMFTLEGATTTPGHALGIAEGGKLAAPAEHCRSVGVNFIPLILESLGVGTRTS